ncbi:MAG: 4a-hydroxytetrahydrobiopterin dehydratase [Candidatus Omnitrophica bacterium]|nr:4a-hydroxytetrahydrobiopterin dehydratase [Candidatus Omnitrophota bacterium]
MCREIADQYIKDIDGWTLVNNIKLSKDFRFSSFREAINFVDKIADLAEEEGHHPAIFVTYNRVTLTLLTNSIGGLSENDFILAAKIDRLMRG